MLTRRLTMAAFAALFAASSSFAMLQSASPAMAAQNDHWGRSAHLQRVDRDDRHVRHDRGDRRRRFASNNGNHYGWNNPHNPQYASGKRRHDAWRDRH